MKPITRHKGGSARWRRPLWLIVGLLCALAELAHAAAVSEELPADIAQLSDSLRRLYAPDQREELFQLDFTTAGRKVMLRGVTTSAPAKRALLDGLRERGYEVMDALSLLPDERTIGRKCYGIVNVSVCNLRTAADYSSEMASQALMGMPVRLLQDEGWFRVQTPDSYIGWVHHVGIHPVTLDELTAWNRAEKLVVVAPYGTVYSQPDEQSQPVSDCVAGNRLKLLGQKKGFYRRTRQTLWSRPCRC